MRLSASELKYEQRAAEAQGSTVGLQPNGEWKIEKLLKLRRRNGATEALVRWDGWAEEYDSWERNLAREIIEEFKEEQAALASKEEL